MNPYIRFPRTSTTLMSLFLLVQTQALPAQESGVPKKTATTAVAAEPQSAGDSVAAASQVVPALPVPRLVKFSGVAKGASGQPHTGVTGMTFSIYASQEGGAALWMETQNIELDAHGHYAALLGSTQSAGMPLDLFATGEQRWLGIKLELPGEVEQPRVLLVSVPYALKASDADTVGGMPASAFVMAPTGAGTKSNAGNGAKSKAGKPGATPACSSCLQNWVPLFTDSSGDVTDSVISQTNGFVAIGNAVAGSENALLIVGNGQGGPVFNGSNVVDTDFFVTLSAPGAKTPVSTFGPQTPSNLALQVGGLPMLWINNSSDVTIGTTGDNFDQLGVVQTNLLAYDALGAEGEDALFGSGSSGGDGVYGLGGGGDTAINTSDGVGGRFFGGSLTGNGGDGINATAGSGYAGNFSGDLNVTGAIFAGTKDFKIDHPLDPANKYLYHASVESSEMKNIYDGTATTDGDGAATVQLPDWFEAVNTDFRYQLTVIGQFAQAIVSSEVANHQFSIKTDKPNVKVSWQITGVRQDAYAKAHPLVVEQTKNARERGHYIHPELYGASVEQSIDWAHQAVMMKRRQRARTRKLEAAQRPATRPQPARLAPLATSKPAQRPATPQQ